LLLADALEKWFGRAKFPSSKQPCLRRGELDRRAIMWGIHPQELDMPRGDKSADTNKQKREASAIEKRDPQKGVSRPQAEARAWAAANKLHGGGKKVDSRRKVPSGPLGGSGRKTNRSRSS
jgi:hypothetical protein